jgi:hypothetical protein
MGKKNREKLKMVIRRRIFLLHPPGWRRLVLIPMAARRLRSRVKMVIIDITY